MIRLPKKAKENRSRKRVLREDLGSEEAEEDRRKERKRLMTQDLKSRGTNNN